VGRSARGGTGKTGINCVVIRLCIEDVALSNLYSWTVELGERPIGVDNDNSRVTTVLSTILIDSP